MQALGQQLYLKETPTQVLSREICEIFKNTYFEEHLRTTAAVSITAKGVSVQKKKNLNSLNAKVAMSM